MKLGWLKKTVKVLLGNLFIFLFLLSLVEGGLYVHYRFLPKNEVWLSAAREYYRSYDADVIQFNLKCAKHHPTLTYTLRPEASCEFNNVEFNTRVDVNSMGSRDDEESLNAPEIIVLGDSHTLGWGVEHNETFSYLLEKKLGVKVLNAGQSSFGTAREAMYLEHLDRSNLKALVVQYADNDKIENGKFIKGGYRIKTMSRISYDLTRKVAMKRVRPYRFGNFIRLYWPLTKNAREEILKNQEQPVSASQQQRLNDRDALRFLKCLAHGPVDLRGIPIYVLEVNQHNENDPLFIQAIEAFLSDTSTEAEYKNLNITTLDVSPLLQLSDYFSLDEHVGASGHQVIAEVLSNAIKEQIDNP